MTVIYVDADACPVKSEISTLAIRHGVRAIMVCNGGIRPDPHPLIDLAIVDDGPDAADIWIAERARTGDIVVTNDIPLAARCLENEADVIRPDGSLVTTANIGAVLATRDLMADIRASDPLSTGHQPRGKPFSKQDRGHFLQQMDQMLSRRIS